MAQSSFSLTSAPSIGSRSSLVQQNQGLYRHGISWVETPRLSAQRLNDFLFSLCVHAGYIFRHILHLKGEAINLPDRLDSAGSSPTTLHGTEVVEIYMVPGTARRHSLFASASQP